MSVAIVIDMNLSIEWATLLANAGWATVHWSAIGDPRAGDSAIMAWARTRQHIVFTHDLDFGTMLAMTNADGPSVIQVRGRNVLPEHMGSLVIAAIRKYESELARGALVVVDAARSRVRVLPLI